MKMGDVWEWIFVVNAVEYSMYLDLGFGVLREVGVKRKGSIFFQETSVLSLFRTYHLAAYVAAYVANRRNTLLRLNQLNHHEDE